ncbi:MAG TPA: response regulator transcription factor [Chryseosolibacter sp.]
MKTLVIVDNEVLLTHALAEIIEGFGEYKVLYLCENGLEMMNRFQQPRNVPDIVLLDIFMPVKNGFETAQWLSDKYPEVKILALSVDDREETVIQMVRCGAKGYLLKNIDRLELKKALDCLMEQGYYYSGWITHKLLNNLSSPQRQNSAIPVNERELEFLKLAASELTYKEIADKMILSPRTVEGYRDQLFEKFSLKSRVGLILYALKEQMLRLEDIKIRG